MNTTIKHRYEPTTSFHWLEFPDKPDADTRAILKAEHWRFIGAVMQWRKAGLLTRLPELPGYEYEECGEIDHSAERAEYYETRADRATERADAAHGKANAIADLIPFGQPILVGHHSERRHRRDLDKIDSNMRRAIEERKKAERLQHRAEAAQEQKLDPGAISRRLDKIRKDHRTYEKATSAEGQRRRTVLAEEIARLEAALEKAGGLPADNIDLQKGDLILIHGHIVEITRVNVKTISGYLASPVHNLFSKESGYTARTVHNAQKWDRSTFQRRIYNAEAWARINEGRTQAEAYKVAEAHLKTAE